MYSFFIHLPGCLLSTSLQSSNILSLEGLWHAFHCCPSFSLLYLFSPSLFLCLTDFHSHSFLLTLALSIRLTHSHITSLFHTYCCTCLVSFSHTIYPSLSFTPFITHSLTLYLSVFHYRTLSLKLIHSDALSLSLSFPFTQHMCEMERMSLSFSHTISVKLSPSTSRIHSLSLSLSIFFSASPFLSLPIFPKIDVLLYLSLPHPLFLSQSPFPSHYLSYISFLPHPPIHLCPFLLPPSSSASSLPLSTFVLPFFSFFG